MLFTLVYAVEHVVGFEHGAIGLWHFQQALSRFVLLLGLIASVHVLHGVGAAPPGQSLSKVHFRI